MSYTYAEVAAAVASPRASGSPSLTVAPGQGAAFAAAAPTVDSPMPVVIFRSDPDAAAGSPHEPIGGVLISGVAGDSLTVDGPLPGWNDAAVLAGDRVACVPTAFDLTALWAAVAAVPAGPQGPKGDQGVQGVQGIQGVKGDAGDAGVGVPVGGTTGQVLAKTSGADYATGWTTPTGGGVSFPLVDGSSQSSGSADQWSFKDTSGAVAAAVDKDGNEGSYEIAFVLARSVDLTAGAGLISSWASSPGKILDIQIKADVNGASGGFTLAIKKNGTGIASQAVAASSTSITTIAAASISSLAIAKGDVFSIDASSVGVGVQSVRVAIRHARRNR